MKTIAHAQNLVLGICYHSHNLKYFHNTVYLIRKRHSQYKPLTFKGAMKS